MHGHKNIIFDLGGVIFEYNKTAIMASRNSEQEKPLKVIEPGLHILKQCHKQKERSPEYKFFVCTNWDEYTVGLLKRDYPEIFSLFDGIVFSCIAQARKPDPAIFQYLLDTYALSSHECIFLDDQEKNTNAAGLLGMTAILVNDFAKVEESLRQLGVL